VAFHRTCQSQSLGYRLLLTHSGNGKAHRSRLPDKISHFFPPSLLLFSPTNLAEAPFLWSQYYCCGRLQKARLSCRHTRQRFGRRPTRSVSASSSCHAPPACRPPSLNSPQLIVYALRLAVFFTRHSLRVGEVNLGRGAMSFASPFPLHFTCPLPITSS